MKVVHFENLDDEESRGLYRECISRGYHPKITPYKNVRRGFAKVDRDNLFIGSIPYIHTAFKVSGIEIPPVDDYPEYLAKFLHRKIWKSILKNVDMDTPVFVKPRKSRKKFPGLVLNGRNTPHVGFSTPVWCSEVVVWRDEFRIFVSNGELVDVVPCPDSRFVFTLDSFVFIRKLLETTPRKTLVIDCGMMCPDNRYAVVEVNEAFSFGGYGLSYSKHLDMLEARWSEILI